MCTRMGVCVKQNNKNCKTQRWCDAEKEMQLPDLPVTATDTCTDLNSEATTRQDLPVEMTTTPKSTSLTVETTVKIKLQQRRKLDMVRKDSENKVQEDGASSAANNLNTGLNVEMSPDNSLDMPIETINIALNVETDLNTQKVGPVTGLNAETSPNDNTK